MESRPILYLSRADVERVAPDMPAIIALLETAFRENAEGRVEMPPKPSLHPGGDAFLNAMPAIAAGWRLRASNGSADRRGTRREGSRISPA